MSRVILEGRKQVSEAANLQGDLSEIFNKILSHARRIDMTMTLGDSVEALGQLRELESYLQRGLDVLSRPLTTASNPGKS